MTDLDFSRCRKVWVPDESEAGGFWSPPPEHVKVGVRAIVANPYFFLCDDMGGMKTAQAIIAAQFLHDADVIDRVIVITPASIRTKVWYDTDLGQLHEQVFEDKQNLVTEYHAKLQHWRHGRKEAKELRWVISNYEFIRSKKNLATLLPYCGPRTMLVLDESSAVRTAGSAQTVACMLLRWQQNKNGRPVPGVPRCGRVLEMNGTPVAESPMDLFSQGNLLHPSILACKTQTHFKGRYALQQPVSLYNPTARQRFATTIVGWRPDGIADLQQRFAPYVLRREAKDFGVDFALPPVGFDVPLTPATWKVYKEMRDEMVVWLKSGVATASQAGVKVIRLAQITSGFLGGIEDANIGDEACEDSTLFSANSGGTIINQNCVVPMGASVSGGNVVVTARNSWTDGTSNVVEIGREKLDFALALQAEWLKRNPNLKLLTWCRFVPELRRYVNEVSRTFRHPVGAACGAKAFDDEQTKKQEREVALRLLHPKTAPVGPATVAATQGTGAMGLNFTACRTVLDVSYDFSPWKKKQGDARVNRTGQTGPVSFFYLTAVGPKGQATIDRYIMLARLGKMQLNDLTTAGWVKVLTEE
jgi:hypothetical protein